MKPKKASAARKGSGANVGQEKGGQNCCCGRETHTWRDREKGPNRKHENGGGQKRKAPRKSTVGVWATAAAALRTRYIGGRREEQGEEDRV